MDICYDTPYPFGFTSRSKLPPLNILKFLVTTFRNQDNKVVFFRVDKYGSLSRSSEFVKTCNNMNIIVKYTGGDSPSLNGKIYIHNKTLADITRALILKSSHKKYLWCFVYQYDIWIFFRTENIFRGGVT